MFSLEHIGLAASDPQALQGWYASAFGAEVVYTNGEEPPALIIRLPGSMLLEIYPSDCRSEETSNNKLAGWRHLALRVDNIEAAREVLSKRGVEFDPLIKPAGGGGRVLFFKDPEGNLWHLVERTAESRVP
jgi:glyoxylase I family protein